MSALPAILTGVGALGSLYSGLTSKNRYATEYADRVKGVLSQGGLGYSPAELTQLYRQYQNELGTQVHQNELAADADATRRGIFDSPLAVGQRGMARTNATVKLADIWKNLQLQNQQQKNSSYMQALGALSGLADQQYQSQAQNQAAWLQLFSTGLDKLLK